MREPYRGLYGILLTTYTNQDSVEYEDLASQADFVAATAQGIFEASYGMIGAREVLKRRGLLRSTASRYSPQADLDTDARAELDATLAFLEPYLRWPDHKLQPQVCVCERTCAASGHLALG
jgi:hypothetical protein